MHFSSFEIPGIGEFTIDDLVLFSETGKLAHVERKWTAVKKYAQLVDQAHTDAIDGVRSFLDTRTKMRTPSEIDLDDIVLASTEVEALTESDNLIVKSLILLLLVSFNEFGLKQVQQCVDPSTSPPPRSAFNWIQENLKAHGFLLDVSDEFVADFSRFISPVRNRLAHGDWVELSAELAALDLTKAFRAVAVQFQGMQLRLTELGHSV